MPFGKWNVDEKRDKPGRAITLELGNYAFRAAQGDGSRTIGDLLDDLERNPHRTVMVLSAEGSETYEEGLSSGMIYNQRAVVELRIVKLLDDPSADKGG